MASRPPTRTLSVLVAATAALALTACGSTSFNGSAKTPKREAPAVDGKKPDRKEAEAKPSENYRPGTDAEDEPTDRPQQVSGAFLACAKIVKPEAAGTAAAKDSFGCRIERGGQKADLAGLDVTWDVLGAGQSILGGDAKLTPFPATLPWHVEVTLPAGQAAGKAVRAAVAWADAPAETLETQLLAPGSPAALRLGQEVDFHLGNGEFKQGSCQAQVRAIPLVGKRITIPFNVLGDGAVVGMDLAEVCGVDYDNAIRLKKDGQEVDERLITADKTSAVFAPRKLEPGAYEIEIASLESRHKDHDDFVIGDIVLTVVGKIEAGAPETHDDP